MGRKHKHSSPNKFRRSLLPKKSWNVYNAKNIERVRRDEAAANAREEEAHRLIDKRNADIRFAKLRGEEPLPELTFEDAIASLGPMVVPNDTRDEKTLIHLDKKKYKKLAGEDDTDRDIRIARANASVAESTFESAPLPAQRRFSSDAPIVDQAGHINIFPEPDQRKQNKQDHHGSRRRSSHQGLKDSHHDDGRSHADRKSLPKNAEAEAESLQRKRSFEDQYTMRFSNAAGKDKLTQKPWYMSNQKSEALSSSAPSTLTTNSYGGNTYNWGDEEPGRKQRQVIRLAAEDPLKIMKQAQAQMDKNRANREAFKAQEKAEAKKLRAAQKEERRERKKQRRLEHEGDAKDRDNLLGFSLGAPAHALSPSMAPQHSPSSSRRRHEDSSRRGYGPEPGRRGEREERRERRRSRSRSPRRSPQRHQARRRHSS